MVKGEIFYFLLFLIKILVVHQVKFSAQFRMSLQTKERNFLSFFYSFVVFLGKEKGGTPVDYIRAI